MGNRIKTTLQANSSLFLRLRRMGLFRVYFRRSQCMKNMRPLSIHKAVKNQEGTVFFCCSTPLWGTQTWLLSFLLRGKIPMFFKFPFCWVDVNISIFLHLTCATKSILNTCIAATVLKYVEIIWNHNFYGRSLMDCSKMWYPKTAMLLGRTMIDPLLWTTPPYLIFA